ncbi:MAG: hypothetical protein A4E53_04490 [Pelotomaculum sp. PtaB.Bin104]|nr:MAG: hypothetical protein A4E53_04490 [Pelotomaculum sp. PtaB.Bin104]
MIPENYDDYKKRIYDGFPSEKEKLDTVFSVLDETVSLMGNVDEPMPFLFSGLEMVKSMLPYIKSAPKQAKLANLFEAFRRPEPCSAGTPG